MRINTFVTLNSGKVLIATNSEEEIETLEKIFKQIVEETNVHTVRKPRLIVLNIPEDISKTNIEDTILMQSPDLNLMK